jgi:hypothetical protein
LTSVYPVNCYPDAQSEEEGVEGIDDHPDEDIPEQDRGNARGKQTDRLVDQEVAKAEEDERQNDAERRGNLEYDAVLAWHNEANERGRNQTTPQWKQDGRERDDANDDRPKDRKRDAADDRHEEGERDVE